MSVIEPQSHIGHIQNVFGDSVVSPQLADIFNFRFNVWLDCQQVVFETPKCEGTTRANHLCSVTCKDPMQVSLASNVANEIN